MSAGMRATPHATDFRHGAGRLSLDFIRTLRYRGRPNATEELPDPAALLAWVAQFGPWSAAEAGAAPSGEAFATQARVRQARQLREAIVELMTAARTGAVTASPASARELVNRSAARPVPAPILDAEGRLSWQADDPVTATLALVARDALELVGSTAVERVRNCANPDCAALFFDGSRPNARRWCSMGTCGNQAKKGMLRGWS